MNFGEALDAVERQQIYLSGYPHREWPPRQLLFFDAGVYLDVALERPEGAIEALCWYGPGEMREIAEPIVRETVPDASVIQFGQLRPEIRADAVDVYRRAVALRSQLEDGTHWIQSSSWWQKPFLTKGPADWLAIELEKGKLKGLQRWSDVRLRSTLCQMLLQDRSAGTLPVNTRVRAKALELDARGQADLDALDDAKNGFEVRERGGFKIIIVRTGQDYARLELHDGKVFHLRWLSRDGVGNDILETFTSGKRGRLTRLDQKLLGEIAVKTNRAKYPELMRQGKLQVGAVPYQTDSEWTLYYKDGEFRIRQAMDGTSEPVADERGEAILRDRAYTFVVFEGRGS